MSKSYCRKEKKECVFWVDKYFKDCLCNSNDFFSFGFGLLSLFCWGVAEIPQIITNFRTKSSHGVSLIFLLTWIAGDAFNLVGCILEPATLPTQFYTAVLYTVSTLVLVYQTIYYDHFSSRKSQANQPEIHFQARDNDEKNHLLPIDSTIPVPIIPLKKVSSRPEFYYTSARSMAGSSTPPFRSYLRPTRSGPPAIVVDSDSSSEDEATSSVPKKSVSRPKPIPRSPVGYGLFMATSAGLPGQSQALLQAYVGFATRKLLHEGGGSGEGAFGQWLGWMMAGIYMGGRLPQIWLNIKRGSVEGLNPLMFVFALIANLAYVASILVRTTDWEKVKPNMAWLLDAAVCVVLDLFIIMQYIYYKYFGEGIQNGKEDDDDYRECKVSK